MTTSSCFPIGHVKLNSIPKCITFLVNQKYCTEYFGNSCSKLHCWNVCLIRPAHFTAQVMGEKFHKWNRAR